MQWPLEANKSVQSSAALLHGAPLPAQVALAALHTPEKRSLCKSLPFFGWAARATRSELRVEFVPRPASATAPPSLTLYPVELRRCSWRTPLSTGALPGSP